MKRIHHVSGLLASALGITAFLALLAVFSIAAGPAVVQAQPQERTLPQIPLSDATSTWGGFQPAGWSTTTTPACSVTVTDSLELQDATAVYRYSTDGGASWSAWGNAGLSIGGDISTTKYLTVTGITFIQSGTDNLIQFQILDTNGDPDTSPAFVVKVDSQAPGAPIGLAASPAGWSGTNSFTLTWTNPADISGIAGAYYKIGTAPSSPTDGTFAAGAGLNNLPGISVPSEGTHTLYLWLKDTAGNVQHTSAVTVTLRYDGTAPAAPTGVTVSPATWTNINDFGLSWSNPADTSGIAGVYYKLDLPPTSAGDGTLVESPGIASLNHLIVSGNGAHPIYIWLKDVAGNADHNARASATFYLDQDLPSAPAAITSTTHSVATWSQDSYVQVNWAGAADATSGIAGYAVAWDQSPETLPAPITTTTQPQAMSPALPDGNAHYVHVRAADLAGNWSASAAHLGPFFIDRTAPAAPIDLTADPITWTNVNQFNLSWTNPADLSGIAGAYYKLDTPPGYSDDGTFVPGENIQSISNITVSGDGAHPVYVWLKDAAGNVLSSQRASTTLYLDTIRPGAPTNLTPSPAGWSNSPYFGITWTNPSDVSGIAGAYYKLNAEPTGPTDGTWVTTTNTITNILVPAEGEHDIYLWLKDRAGNVEHQTRNVLLRAFKYDATPPSTTHTVTGTLGNSGWYTSAVSVGLSASDNLAGVQRTEYRIGANPWQAGSLFNISASGIYTVSYRSIDNANNEETAHELAIWLDREVPTTGLAISGTMGANGWYTSPVTVTFVVTDPVSGRDSTLYRLDGGIWQAGESLVVDSDGIHTLEYYSIDRAGNRESTHTATLRVDLLPPLTMYVAEGTAGDGGWFRSPVTVTLTPTDLASGPAATYYRLDAGSWISGTKVIISSEGNHSLSFYSRDYAGNLEASQAISVNIDVTPPLPPFGLAAQPAGWTKTNAFTVTWSSFADLSGIGGAYYKLNAEPTHPADGTYAAGATNQITGIPVPEEGKHSIYLWLRDGAGNANHLTRNVLNQALWLDITPPTTTHVLTGSLGLNGWYTSPVQVGLSAVDALSGVDRFFYRILGVTDWNQGQFFPITTSGRHSIQYYAVDVAGNEESTKTGFVRVDLEAPPAPINLRAEQVGWQSENNFSAVWDNPLDTSLIGAAYYKLDAPPAHPGDGTLISNLLSPRIDGIHVPSEGKHDLYVWLRDNAGNSDHTHHAHVSQAFWYDARPPTTTYTITGTSGFADWYRSPVSITFSAADEGSGVLSTIYRVDGGLWQTGSALMVSAEGTHTVQFYSIDQAGNNEPLRTLTVKIDTRAPSSVVVGPAEVYQEENVFPVSWSGSDPTPGSGLLGYDIQYRMGRLGSWTNWRTATDEVSGLFAGQRGRLYFFRSRARDRAGNEEAYPAGDGDRMVYIEPVANGRFETRDLTSWTHGGELGRRVESLSTHGGGTSYMVVLGNPELGPCYDNQPSTLPVGSAYISQTVYVPAPPDVVAPKLHFWYRILTYDVVWSERYQRYYDSFDVEIAAGGPAQLLLRDGNYDPLKVGAGKPVVDLGWKEGVIDLSPYAGQTVTLYFRNSNRVDNYFNTWTYLDDISITDSVTGYKVRVPLVARALAGTAAGQTLMQAAGGPR